MGRLLAGERLCRRNCWRVLRDIWRRMGLKLWRRRRRRWQSNERSRMLGVRERVVLVLLTLELGPQLAIGLLQGRSLLLLTQVCD